MKFADDVQESTSSTTMATIVLTGAQTNSRRFADGFTIGDTDIPVWVRSGALWLYGLYTLTDATHLTRQGAPHGSSNNGAEVTFPAGASVYNDVPAEYLNGTSLVDYVTSNDAGNLADTDTLVGARGTGIFGMKMNALTSLINRLLLGFFDTEFPVNSTASFAFDSSVHNRRVLMLYSPPDSITVPSAANFASRVGNGFKCEIINESGADVPLPGVAVRPSGTVLPNGAAARVRASSGTLYAHLYGTATAAAATAPGALSGLTAGTATSTTQPLSWAASSNATGYRVEYKLGTDTNWTVFAANNAGLTGTVTGLTPATAYNYRVTPLNGATAGTAATVNASTVAAAGGGGGTGGAAPFTLEGHSASDAFPYQSAIKTYDASYWGQAITPTGAATIVSISGALSESNTVVPTNAIDWTKPAGSRGRWIGAIKNYNNSGNWLTAPDGTNVNTIGIQASLPVPVTIYLWVFLKDSNNVTWTFVYPGTQVGDNVTTAAPTTRVTPTLFTQ